MTTRDAWLLGRGLRFPVLPARHAAGASRLRWIEGVDAVEQALLTLLLTEPGERIGHEQLGVGLRRFLYAPNSVATRTLIRRAVEESVSRDEPRAQLESVDVYSDDADESVLRIDIRYSVIGESSPRALVFPFYLDGRQSE
ncbi:MAG: GPW/gp25 family protein [Sandaracinaceae bacterium]